MSNRHLYILCLLLVLVGGLMTAYRMFVLGFPLTPQATSETWQIEVRAGFEGQGTPISARLFTLQNGGGFSVISESFVAPGFGVTAAQPSINRIATFTVAKASGPEAVYYSAVVHRADVRHERARERKPTPQRSEYVGAKAAAAQAIVRRLKPQAADSGSFVRLLVHELMTPQPGREAAELLGPHPTRETVVETAVRVLNDADVPARVVHGLKLEPDRRDARLSRWLEYWRNDQWVPFDPETGAFQVPEDHIPWWRGARPFLSVTGAAHKSVRIAVRKGYEFALGTALERASAGRHRLIEFSLFGLPLQTQEVYRILLVVPVGLLLLVVLRNVVGVKTFGTFMPVLIAMAFRQTHLIAGVVMFSAVVAFGLLVRFYLERLKLLLVPRLASVVLVVIMIMAMISIVSHKLGFERGLSVALFPIVIMSMTIERMTVVWEERGPKEALQQGLGSLTVAVLSYLLMNIALIQHFLFVFPESLLIVLAACLLMGRYSGYRLVELYRFRVLAGRDGR